MGMLGSEACVCMLVDALSEVAGDAEKEAREKGATATKARKIASRVMSSDHEEVKAALADLQADYTLLYVVRSRVADDVMSRAAIID